MDLKEQPLPIQDIHADGGGSGSSERMKHGQQPAGWIVGS
jgi:hypothetical protein